MEVDSEEVKQRKQRNTHKKHVMVCVCVCNKLFIFIRIKV